MSIQQTIIDLANGTYAIERRQINPMVNGRMEPPTVTNLTALALAEPITGKDIKRFTDGRQIESGYKIFTLVNLFIGDANFMADVITINGERYELTKHEPWSALGESFNKYFAIKFVK